MTSEQIATSIKTGVVQLGRWDKFNYYFPSTALFYISSLAPTFWLYDLVIGFQKPSVVKPGDPSSFTFILVPLILGILLFVYQRRQLRLIAVVTRESIETNRKLIKEIADRLEWQTVANRKDVFVAVTHPPFWSGSWGERITVLYGNDVIWVNSICDPEKRSSVMACGRNKANVRAVTRKVTNPAKKAFLT